MTLLNVANVFGVTGICPFDRNAICLPPAQGIVDSDRSLAPQKSIAYIPLYSPAPKKKHSSLRTIDTTTDVCYTEIQFNATCSPFSAPSSATPIPIFFEVLKIDLFQCSLWLTLYTTWEVGVVQRVIFRLQLN